MTIIEFMLWLTLLEKTVTKYIITICICDDGGGTEYDITSADNFSILLNDINILQRYFNKYTITIQNIKIYK